MINFELSNFENYGKVIKNGGFSTLGKLGSLPTNNGYNDLLVFIENYKVIDLLRKFPVSCVITTDELFEEFSSYFRNLGVMLSKNPRETFYKIHIDIINNGGYIPEKESIISKNTVIGKNTWISPKNVVIGDNVVIEENVIVKHNVIIGSNVIIQSGSIIGNDGFEVTVIDGVQTLIPHGGSLIIGDNVVIQSNSTICKGLFPSANTYIGNEVIIDSRVHISHGVVIGEKTKIGAGATISGNVRIGKNVWIGPSAVVTNRIKIGDNSFITLGSVVVSNVGNGERVSGNFAVNHYKFLRHIGEIMEA